MTDETPRLPPGFSRETTIRRDAHGRWFHDGILVENERIRRAFDQWIDVADDGRYRLTNGVNWAYVEIDGPPLFVLGARIDEDGKVWLALSNTTTEQLDPNTLRQDAAGHLYCDARDGALAAKFTTAAAVALSAIMDEDDLGIFLVVGAKKYRPGLFE